MTAESAHVHHPATAVPKVSRVIARVEFEDGTGYEFEAPSPYSIDIRVDPPSRDYLGCLGPLPPEALPGGEVGGVTIKFKASSSLDGPPKPMEFRRL